MSKYVITILILLFLFIYLLTYIKKCKTKLKTILNNNLKKYHCILCILSIIVFTASFFIELFSLDNYNFKNTLNAIYNTITILILSLPLETLFLYSKDADKEKYLYVKTIITEENITPKILKKFNKAGIKIISYTEKNTLNLKELPNLTYLNNNCNNNFFLNKQKFETIDQLVKSSSIYLADTTLTNIYDSIYESRNYLDKFIKIFKYNFLTYFPLIISYFFLKIMAFPVNYSLNLSLIIKLITTLFSNFLYINFPKDVDLMHRNPLQENKFFYKQELVLLFIQAMFVFFGSNLVYIYLITNGANINTVLTVYLIIIIYSNLFIKYILLTEKNFFYNFSYIIKNKYILIYSILTILLSIIINFTNLFNTANIGFQNYLAAILIAFLSTIIFEITKIARLTNTKGNKKNVYTNNKKYNRS